MRLSKRLSQIAIGLNFLFALSALAYFSPEPPFPPLLDPVNRPRIHIISESFDINYGHETIEEYIDLFGGKATYISSSKQGQHTTFIDSISETIYRYKPFSCSRLNQSELTSAGEVGIWSKSVPVHPFMNSFAKSELHLFEVAAAWLNAGDMPKSYSKSKIIYNVGTNTFKAAHKWTVKTDDGSLVNLYFTEVAPVKASSSSADSSSQQELELKLEMIQEESAAGKITRTINILSIDYFIPAEIYETLLEVPLGYGCQPDNKLPDSVSKLESINSVEHTEKHNRFRIEATATRFTKIESDERSSDTINLDLLVESFTDKRSIHLVRQRSSHKDIKVVTDNWLQTSYSIDLRRGTCGMSHANDWRLNDDRFSIDFNNGLKLAFDWRMSAELFDASPGCKLIKVTDRGRPIEFVYLECPASKELFSRAARILKKYSLAKGFSRSPTLKSVTVWLLNDELDANEILESYHFHIVDSETISRKLELVRLFDVSEECYINNELMRYGRDYVWLDLNYPLASRQSDLLAEHTSELRAQIYQQFGWLFGGNVMMRIPRIELMFTETGLIVRTLLLDLPSVVHMFDSYPGQVLKSESMDARHDHQLADSLLVEQAVDVEHCAKLCKLYRCQAMSYCPNNFNCLLRTTALRLITLGSKLAKQPDCTTWARASESKNQDDTNSGGDGDLFARDLQFTVSSLMGEDLSNVSLPEMPGELLYPQSVTGLSDQLLSKLQSGYMASVQQALGKSGHLLHTISLTLQLEHRNLMILIPNKLELEKNPLAEFSATELSEDGLASERLVGTFHEGLPLHRYRLSGGEPQRDDATLDAHQYVGLTYDQCALACADARCSSFSYCKHRQDCVITNVFNIESARRGGQIIQDTDCFVAQRDFLSKFNKFAGPRTGPSASAVAAFKKRGLAQNPSECAHSCVVESEFNCLAFDYCDGSSSGRGDSECYYFESRIIHQIGSGLSLMSAADNTNASNPASVQASTLANDCIHYSRSQLADFVRVAYRQVNASQLEQLKTTSFFGHSVDKCAEICLDELTDCTAFQFCFDPESSDARQMCTMIESKPTGQDNSIVQDSEGKIIKQSKLFVISRECHIYAMRADSIEAQMRDVALRPLTPAQLEADKLKQSQSDELSVVGTVTLFITMTVVFAALGSGLVLVKEHNPYLKDRFDRFKARFGYY